MNETITKICTKCGVEKELSEFSFRSDANDYRRQCKQCVSNNAKIRYIKNIESVKEYQILNKDKIQERRKRRYILNSDEIKAKRREYCKNNPDKIKKQRREYYLKNQEKVKEIQKNYRKTEAGRMVAKNMKHRRRTANKKGDVTTNQLLELQQNEKVCYWCNTSLKGKKIHIDHYIPLSKGGKHTLSNLVVSCSTCNNEKHAKDPIEFAQSLGRLL